MSRKFIIRWRPLALCGLALLGFALRLYGLNWDQGNSFQPDERQILFHVTTLAWPVSLAQFLNPAQSPLNPHFFAYGSFPLYLLALLGSLLSHISPALRSFTGLTLVGRALSAAFDSGTIALTGWLALLLVRDDTPGRPHAWSVALLAAALVAFTPFQLQLAHFYAVDTLLLFFVMLTIVACVALVTAERPLLWSFIAGTGYGLALATKFSAAPLAVPLLIAIMLRWRRERDILSALNELLSAALICMVAFVVTQPYAILDWQEYSEQILEQGALARGVLDVPYTRQFAGTIPVVYELRNMVVWGMGVTLGLAACVALLWFLWRFWRRAIPASWLVIFSWILVYGAITCSFYVKYMRYMLPLYPLLTLLAAAGLVAFVGNGGKFVRDRGKKVETGKTGVGEAGTGKTGVRKTGVGKTGVGEAGTEKRGLGKTGVGKTGVGKTGMGKTGVGKTGASPVSTLREGGLRDVEAGLARALPGWREGGLRDTGAGFAPVFSRASGVRSHIRSIAILSYSLIALVLGGTIFQGLALLNVYSVPNTRVVASQWIYSHLPPESVLTYEQWDDPLPVPVGNHYPQEYVQATYIGPGGQPTTGLDLYDDDTPAKARMLANLLPTIDAITMASDRLDKSIPRLPARYPLTIHYYHLLFSGQLGFHLAAQFENRPNLFGITLDDSSADESYSVFDHPTVRIFVRDNPYPYTPDQLYQKLMAGVHLPSQT